jgi:hypothetical protein
MITLKRKYGHRVENYLITGMSGLRQRGPLHGLRLQDTVPQWVWMEWMMLIRMKVGV